MPQDSTQLWITWYNQKPRGDQTHTHKLSCQISSFGKWNIVVEAEREFIYY